MGSNNIAENNLSVALNLHLTNKHLEAIEIAEKLAINLDIDTFQRALASNFVAGIYYVILSEYNAAKKYYDLSVELCPENANFLMQCAAFNIQMNFEIDKAFMMAQKALELFKKHPDQFTYSQKDEKTGVMISGNEEFLTNLYAAIGNYHMSKGRAGKSLSEIEKAYEYLAKSIETNGYIPYPYFKMAELYQLKKDISGSLGFWNRGICIVQYFLKDDSSMRNVYRDLLLFLSTNELDAYGLAVHALSNINKIKKDKNLPGINLAVYNSRYIIQSILHCEYYSKIFELMQKKNTDIRTLELFHWCVEICLGNIWKSQFINSTNYSNREDKALASFSLDYANSMMFLDTHEADIYPSLSIPSCYSYETGVLHPDFLLYIKSNKLDNDEINFIKEIYTDFKQKIQACFYNNKVIYQTTENRSNIFSVDIDILRTAIIIHLASAYHSVQLKNVLSHPFNITDILYISDHLNEIVRNAYIQQLGRESIDNAILGISKIDYEISELDDAVFKLAHKIISDKRSEDNIVDLISAHIYKTNSNKNDVLKLTQILYINRLITAHAKCLLDSYHFFRHYDSRFLNALKIGTALALTELSDLLFISENNNSASHLKKIILFFPSYFIGNLFASSIEKLVDSKMLFDEFREEFYSITGNNVLAAKSYLFVEK